jgi:LuxR family transcriptional regulator, maltose regulon positive regulatory protein
MEGKAEQETLAGRGHIIERPRLTRLLDETPVRVVMLVAPAGYGKTTLARQWLEHRPHAWYQGGASSSDVAALSLGLAEASEALLSDVGRRLREWLPTSRAPDEEVHVIEQFLSEDFAAWPEDAWFVVDDYHMLTSHAAEDLIRRLFVSSSRRLLLTSRQRPAWASARALLYGDFFELGQSALAMNLEEANAVLAFRHADAARGLVALADGWPAVIGLAALTPTSITLDEDVPDELHDYFAEELFASLPEDSREGLCRLALVPVANRPAAKAILGSSAERVLTVAREAGMFTAQRAQELVLHPLLRTFLLQKLLDAPRSDVSDAVTRATDYLIGVQSWDDAFSLISKFSRDDLLDNLVSRAIIPLTKQGRLATIREWLDFARRNDVATPYIDLADAELSFRQGVFDRAAMLAKAAANGLEPNEPLKSAAYYRAGQSSLLADEVPSALEYFRSARETAKAPLDSRNALWGEFLAALELERHDVSDRLEEFSVGSPHDPDTRLRAAAGRLALATRVGNLKPALLEAAAVRDLVAQVSDPTVRSSFWHADAAALALAGLYSEALEAVDEALGEIESFNIEFARAHTFLNAAMANVGLQRYREAEGTLTELEALAMQRRDDYVLTNARVIRSRLLLQTGLPEEALGVLSAERTKPTSRSMQAEFLATKAAALACAGQPHAAADLGALVPKVSIYLEPRLIAQWVNVICAFLLGRADAQSLARTAYERTASTGALDIFIFAYRLHPEILRSLANQSNLREALTNLVVRVNDVQRGAAAGLDIRMPRRSTSSNLTKREEEVYGLLAEGKTNREIAGQLFISEVTAKVHVRNVLRKLGVRTRTQAAVKAVREEERRR